MSLLAPNGPPVGEPGMRSVKARLPYLINLTVSSTLAGVIQLDAPATSSFPHFGCGQNGAVVPAGACATCWALAMPATSVPAATAPPTSPAVRNARRSSSTDCD